MSTVTLGAETFGQEHELVQRVVASSRSLGAGEAFWAKLADNPSLLKQAVELVEGSQQYVNDGYFVYRTSGGSLMDLWADNQDLFFLGGDHWWKDEVFANVPGVRRNVALYLGELPGSRNKLLHEQRQLLRDEEVVPCAAEVVEGLILLYRLNGVRALQDCSVRTSDTTLLGCRVDVGIFKPDGMVIDNNWDTWHPQLGLGAAKYLG